MSSTNHLSELESLRSQVADLTRALAEREQSTEAQRHHLEETMQDLRERSHLLHTIIEGTASEIGDEFFASLVTHLTSTLPVQYAVIGEVCEEGRLKKIRTMAVSAGGALVDNFEYELAHTPCATTLTQGFACFDRDLQATFPQFQRLADLGAESYCAVPLRTKDGAVIGLLAVMDTKPLQRGDDVKSLLSVFAPRVAVEFERRRTEQEHAQALADLHNVIETVPDVMFTLDITGNLVKWNRRLGDVTGYSHEELLNKSALAFVPLEEQTRTAAAIQRAFTEGYAELDGQMLTKDLRTIPYHWTGALLKNAQGEPIGVTGVGRDVSEKKQVEEELTQQRRHLVDAQALAHLGSWGWDIDTGEVQWSDEQFRIFGHEPGLVSVTYDTFLAALLPDDHERVLAAVNDALVGKRSYDIEYRIVRPNGEVRFVHARGDVYRDMTGHPFSMAGTVLDITERKRIEDALRISEERWHLAVRGSNDGIWDWNIQSGDVFFSSRWKAMRGFEDHEIKDDIDEWRSRIHPDDLNRVIQSIDAYLAKHAQEFCEEYRVQRKDGSCMWILDRGVALWADDGTPLRMAGSETDITARKGAEEALEESEERFALAVMGSTDILWDAHRLHGEPWYVPETPIWWSPGVQELLGLEESEPFETLEQWAVRLHPEDKERVFSQLTAHIDQRVPYDAEYRLRTNRGDYRWIRGRGQAMWDEHGEIRRMSGSCQDITERKRTEEALQMQASVLRCMLEGVSLSDANGVILYTNPAEDAMFGYEPGELIGKHVTVLNTYPPEENSRIVEGVIEQLKARGSWEGEFSNRRKDGSPFTTFAHITALELSGKKHWVCVQADITERKQAEESLRVSEERFNLAVRGSNTGIWDWDLRTNKTYFSPLWKSMLGYEEHELRGEFSDWEERLHPDDRERALATVRAYLGGTTPQYELEHRLRHKDGSYRWILARGVSISEVEGSPYRMAGSHIDITEQKQTQEALAQSGSQLRTVLDALPVGVWFTDQFGKPLLANPAAKQIWSGIRQVGIETTANAAGWWEAISPTSELHRWALSHALTTGVPSLHESLDLEFLDGTKKTIRNVAVPVRDGAGVVLGAIVVNEDITALRQAQETLRLTQFSVDHAVEGFFWIGSEAKILRVNDAACRMLEYSRDELMAMTMPDIDPTLPPEVWLAYWRELKQKGSLTFESKHWTKTGRVLDTEVTFKYLQYEGKEYNCAIMRDIGERKRAEAALRASEERYRSLYDDTPTMYFTLATNGTVLSVNRFGADQLGYRVEELVGKSVLGVFHKDDKEVADACLSECLATPGKTRNWEFRKVRKDGRIIWVRETVRVGQSSTGATVVLVTCEDITDRKWMGDALRQRERDLRAAIEERERISQDLHDGILQSLFAVGLTLEASKSTMSPGNRKTAGPPLDQAIGQLNCVMREIRNFIAGLGSDLLQGKDLQSALQHMLDSLTQNQATHVRLAVEDRAAQAVSVEQSLHLLLVIQEAVSNCIRHGRAQEATVSLKMLKQGIRLSVRDNGRGFNPEAATGTGHGLANMAVRARKIGGRFTVMSKANEGTRIILDFPKEASNVLR